MKLKPSVGCHSLLAAVIATLATVAQLFAADPAVTINWSNPADIVYGTALSGSQLNATFTNGSGAVITGTASYEPQLGTYLPAGDDQSLKVTFVPNSGQGVTGATATVTLDVKKAPLTATIKSKTAAYGQALVEANAIKASPSSNIIYTGWVRNEGPSQIIVQPAITFPAGVSATSDAGTAYALSFSTKPVASNYAIETVNGTLTVVQADLVFTLLSGANSPWIYFGANPVLGGKANIGTDNGPFSSGVGGTGVGWANNELSAANVEISHVHSVKNSSNVGLYDISVVVTEKTPGLLSNYNIIMNNGTYEVKKRPLTVVMPAVQNIVYGASLPKAVPTISMTDAASWKLTTNFDDTKDATKLAGYDKILTSPIVITYPAANSKVGTGYKIKSSGGSFYGDNFKVNTYQESVFDITPATLRIKASNRSKITGANLPTLGVEFIDDKEFKHGDQPEDVFKPWPPVLAWDTNVQGRTTTALDGNGVANGPLNNDAVSTADNGVSMAEGFYQNAIVFNPAAPGGGTKAGNYNIVASKGDLEVTLQPIQFVWSPNTTIMTYGDMFSSVSHLNAVSASSIMVGDKLTSVPVTTSYALVDKNGAAVTVGAPATAVMLTGATVTNGKLDNNGTVAKEANGIDAGTIYVKLTVSVDQTTVNLPANANLKAALPNFGDATQTIAFSVGKKSLEVVALDQTRSFNTTTPFDKTKIDFKDADYVTGEGDGDITTNPEVKDPTTKDSNVDTYSIIPSGGADENYTFVFKAGKFKITQASVVASWTPDAAGGDTKKWITYGTSLESVSDKNLKPTTNPVIPGTWSYSVATADPTALTYPSVNVVATFTPDSPNWIKATASALINVKRRDVNVSPNGVTLVFGDAIPALTGSSNFIESDGITTSFQTGAILGSDVGTYSISAKFDDSKGRLKNYNVKLASDAQDNTVIITPATVSLAAQNASTGVDENQAVLELVMSGLKAEAAVLNGISLTVADITSAFSNNTITYYDEGAKANKTANNTSNSSLTAAQKALALLGRVFKDANNLPSLSISPTFDKTKEGTFATKVGLNKDNKGNITALNSNYVIGTVTDGVYGVGKINSVFTIGFKDGKGESANVPLVYGNALKTTMILPILTKPTETSTTKGTWSYTVNGEPVNGQILPYNSGKPHKVAVTYTPHSSKANVHVPTTIVKDLFIAQAPLRVAVKNNSTYVYGDPLPYINTVEYVYGSGTNNKDNNFVNGEDSSVFTQQPVVVIRPKKDGNQKPTDFSVFNSGARIEFAQVPVAANYDITAVDGTMAINHRPLTVKASDTTIAYGESAILGLDYINLASGETSAVLENAGFAYLAGSQDTTVLNPGTYTIYSGGAYGTNYITTHTTGVLTVSKKPAVITIAGSTAVYDGTAKGVTVTTEPAGLVTSVTYDGATALPVDAGSYAVKVTIDDVNYAGTVDGTLTISPAPVAITLAGLNAKYNGKGKAAKVTATPSVDVSVTYDGLSTLPIAVGSYAVAASPSDSNYNGEANGTLVIDKGTAFIIPSNFAQTADGTAKRITVDTEPEGLETTVTYSRVYELLDPILLDFGNEGDTASGTPGSPWLGFSELVVDESYDLGNGITMTAQGDGFSPNNPAGSGSAADYDSITVPVAARDDYLFKTDDTPGGTAKLVFNGLPAGVYSVTMFEGRTTDVNQVAKLWAGGNRDEPAEANVASFAGGGTTIEVTVTEGDSLYYLHMEDGSGGISGMIIRNVSRPDAAVDAPIEAGIYSAVITVVDDSYRGSLTTAMGLIPGATLEFTSLSSAYTGSANPVVVETNPAGLQVNVTYSKSPNAPSAPGTYPVVATIIDNVYSGTITGNYVIEPAPAAISVTNLSQPFNSAVAPTVVTTPAGLATVITYNGSLELPAQPGEYEVVVMVVDDIYAGSITETLSLGKGGQSITFPAIPNLSINGVSLALVLNASASSGLPITYNVQGGATLDGNILTINQPGIVTIIAQQLGNEVYAAAEEKSRFFNVTGTGIPLGAAQSVASLDDDGNLSVSTSGQPFQEMSVYKAGEVNGEFTPILKVMLDENGQSTFKTETSGDQGYFQVK